jgi:cold-inducible RNA-binding protein
MRLYIGNLNKKTTTTELQELVVPFGAVSSCEIATERHSGMSRGFGFVDVNNDEEARAAIEGLNGREVDGSVLTVNEARPRTNGPRN